MSKLILGFLASLAVIAFLLVGALIAGSLGIALTLGFISAGRVIWARWQRGRC